MNSIKSPYHLIISIYKKIYIINYKLQFLLKFFFSYIYFGYILFRFQSSFTYTPLTDRIRVENYSFRSTSNFTSFFEQEYVICSYSSSAYPVWQDVAVAHPPPPFSPVQRIVLAKSFFGHSLITTVHPPSARSQVTNHFSCVLYVICYMFIRYMFVMLLN